MNSILSLSMTCASRCIGMVHYHSHSNVQIVYRDPDTDAGAQPELFDRECRNYLEGPPSLVGDFVYANVNIANPDGLQTAMRILEHGTKVGKLGRWFAYAWWMQDQEVAFVLNKEQHAGTDTFSKLGIVCKFGAKSDANKASKYLKRLFAHHHEGMWFGEVVERRNGCVGIRMANGARLNFVIREVGYDQAGHALDDGIQYMTVKAFHALTGKRVAPGSGYQITALEASGLIKGHVEIVEDNDLAPGVDGIFIGPKKQVKALGNRFTIGFLQEIHGRNEIYTDIQSVINFKLWKFLKGWAFAQLSGYRAELDDTAAINASILRMLEKQHSDPAWFEATYLPAQIYLAEQKYGLGLHPNLIPACAYRLGRMTEKKIEQMCLRDPRGQVRVAIPSSVAFARYAVVDKTALFNGGIDEHSGVLTSGQAFVGGEIGQYVRQMHEKGERVLVWVHRQPNGHSDEKYLLELVWSEELEEIFGAETPFVHISVQTIGKMMSILGGGDQDDCLICYYDQEVVKHFAALPAYPPLLEDGHAKVVAVVAPPSEIDGWDSGYSFNRMLMAQIINKKATEKESIGSAVLPLMLYNHLWHENLTEGLYDFSHVGWKLEMIIDALVKDGVDISFVTEARQGLYQSLAGHKVPRWAKRKLNPKLFDKYEYQVADTEFDEVLGWMEHQADRYVQFLKRHTHHLVLDRSSINK